MKIAVSGIPRGHQSPRPDGNWLTDADKAQIAAIAPEFELVEIPADRVHGVAGVEIVLAEGGNRVHYPGELDWVDYQKFFTPDLKWVQLCSTGFSDNITPEIVDGRVTLTNAPGLHTIPIAESVLAAMLDHAKNLKQRRIDQENHDWRQRENDELFGRTVLVIGLGRIGKRAAALCHAFGMQVVGTKRQVRPVDGVDLVFPAGELVEHLPAADYVVVAAPLTPETEHMLGAAAFAAMKPTAYLINVGRGKVVDERAMIRALQAKRIGGAYLDALVEEPLPADHVLWDLENVLLVAHDSHSSPAIGDRMAAIFCDNLRRYVAGEHLKNVCDPGRGY